MKSEIWIKKYRYQIAAFLLAFVPRVILNMTAYPLRTLTDELATISSAAFLAGKDWSQVVVNSNYYGFGFSVFFAPLFYMTDNPIVLYRVMLVAASLMQSLTALIAFHLLRRYYAVSDPLYLTAASVACSYMVVTRSMIVYNEHMLIFCSWIAAWLLLSLSEAVKAEDKKRRNRCSVFLILILTYAMTLHTRAITYWIVLAAVIVLYLLAEHRLLLSWKILIPLSAAGYLGSRKLIGLMQNLLWASKESGTLRNTKVKLKISTDFLKPENRGPWSNIIIGQINTAAVISGGLLILGLILGVVLFARYLRHLFAPKGEKKELEWNYLLILLYFGMLILGTVAAQSFMWLKQTREPMVLGTGTWAYGMKATTYVRYMGPYLGPVLMAVLAYFHEGRTDQEKLSSASEFRFKKERNAVERRISLLVVTGLYVTWGLHLLWGRKVYPYVFKNTYALECYLPAAFQNIRNLQMEKHPYLPAVLLSAALTLFFCICLHRRKSLPVALVIAVYLMYQYCYNAAAFDLADQKAYRNMVQSSFELVQELKRQPDFDLKDIYVVELRGLMNQQNYYLFQFYLNDFTVVPKAPEGGEEILLFTDADRCPVENARGYQSCALDNNEYVWVKGERLQNMVKSCGVMLHE